MAHPITKPEFERVLTISHEMDRFVPESTRGSEAFRAELSGFLVVSLAAGYENAVKSIMVSHASQKHPDFENFAARNFEKLSSKVRINDLKRYSRLFGDEVEANFKLLLNSRRIRISKATGFNIESRYEQILNWRHEYAHAGVKNTTITEAREFHRYALHVVECFALAFDLTPPAP